MCSALLIALSIGEVILRIHGENQTYGERIENPIYHIIFTTYESAYTPRESGWLHVQSKHWIMTNEPTATNSEGLYDIEHPLKKVKKCRILALGDSFTEGVGSSNDSNFVKLLEKGNDTLEVINAGMHGSDPAFELKLLEMRMFKYNPDVVIMSVNSSDVTDFMIRGGMERFLPDSTLQFRPMPWWDTYYGYSFIVRYVVNNICNMDLNLMSHNEEVKARAKALNELANVIEKTSQECQQHRIRFVVNFHPMLQEIYSDSMDCSPVMHEIQKHNIEAMDMMQYFKSHGIDSLHASQYYLQDDGHNNNRGYAMMAKGLSTLF